MLLVDDDRTLPMTVVLFRSLVEMATDPAAEDGAPKVWATLSLPGEKGQLVPQILT